MSRWATPTHPPLLERLADKFLVDDGCWEWTASRTERGYGHVSVDGRVRPAHAVLYELLIGPIPDGLELDHLCRNHGCVRPSHLEAVTHAENVRRGMVGWKQREQTHCKSGHEFTPENTYVYTDAKGITHRYCRTCRKTYDQRHKEKRRATR